MNGAVLTIVLLLSSQLMVVPAGDELDLDEGLVFHYDLEGMTAFSEQVEDVSGNGHDAEIDGNVDVVEDSVIGRGIRFDLSEGLIVRDVPDMRGSFTISIWICPEQEPVRQYMGIIDDGFASDGVYHRLLLGDDTGWVEGSVLGQFHGNFFSGSAVGWDRWNHVVYIYDEDANRQYIYINGGSAGTRSGSKYDCVLDGSRLRIGAAYDDRYRYQGMMDDIRLYDRALGPDEVFELTRMGMEIGISAIEVNELDGEVRLDRGEERAFELLRITNPIEDSIVTVTVDNLEWLIDQGIDVLIETPTMEMYPGYDWTVTARITAKASCKAGTYPMSLEIVSQDLPSGNLSSNHILLEVVVEHGPSFGPGFCFCMTFMFVLMSFSLIVLSMVIIIKLARRGSRSAPVDRIEPAYQDPGGRPGVLEPPPGRK